MSLKKALDDCLIDFDRRVLVTDLLEEYKLSYKEVHEVLETYIGGQEPATKFDKRFLVHGKRKDGNGNGTSAGDELYSVVRESQLPDWLAKLQDAESQLYSVEIAGGSKSPAMIFKPMQHLEVKLANVKQRAGKPAPAAAPTTNGVHKTNGAAPETSKKPVVKPEPAKTSPIKTEKPSASKDKSPSDGKNTSPKGQASKTKPGTSGVAKKGSINSFFTAAAAGSKQNDVKATPSKASTGTMDNFFTKQQPGAKKPPPKDSKKPASAPLKKEPSPIAPKKQSPANTSVQLFEAESGESSDEEEKLDKLRRKVIESDNESDQEKASSNTKRRRIVDSEDEDDEQPPKKTAEEPAVVDVEEMDTEPANETYLDDEGFVITQRKPAKARAAPPPAKKKVSPKAAAPANKKKSPPSTGKGAGDGTKTKQAGIMSFFTKK